MKENVIHVQECACYLQGDRPIVTAPCREFDNTDHSGGRNIPTSAQVADAVAIIKQAREARAKLERADSQLSTARHTCGGPVFGRKTKGCPRCDELLAGAAPKQGWGRSSHPFVRFGRYDEVPTEKHSCKESKCAPICTWGDW